MKFWRNFFMIMYLEKSQMMGHPEYDHLFIQANPQLFWWTPISGFTPTSQMQEGHPLAILQNLELQWSTQPEHTSLDTALAAGMKGLQLRSFKSQPTDFTYNPTIMFTLTTTTYSDSSWIKMDAIIDVKRTLVVEFDFDDACNFNINPYIDLTLKPHTIKHYYNYNSHPNYRSFRPGPRMSFKHKKKQGKFMPFKIMNKMGVWGKRPKTVPSNAQSITKSALKRH